MAMRRWRWVVGLAAVGVIFALFPARGAEFTADFKTIINGKVSAAGTLYVKGRNVRQEKTVGTRLYTMILNWDRKEALFLDPEMKTYWEQATPRPSLELQLQALKGMTPEGVTQEDLSKLGFKTTQLGTETVNGFRCEKSVIQGDGVKTTIWFSKVLDWPVWTETVVTTGTKTTTYRTEYEKIWPRGIPDSEFRAPRGYRKIPRPLSEK